MGRSAEIAISGTGTGISLGDLRWLMDKLDSSDDNVMVRLSYSPTNDPRETSTWKISATIQSQPLPDLRR